MRHGWTSLAFAAASAACSFTALDGFSGGASAGGTGDGGGASSSSSGAAASSSSSSSGASSSSSSSGDGGTPLDSGACAFCTNFEGTTFKQLGLEVWAPAPGRIEIDNGTVRARLPELSDGTKPFVAIERDVSTTARRVTLEVDVNVDEDASWNGFGGSAVLLAVGIRGQDQELGFELYFAGTYTNITTNNDGAYTFDNTSSRIPVDRAVRVRLEGDFTAGNGSYKLFYDGSLVGERAGIAFKTVSKGATEIMLGLARNNPPTPALDVRYDNLAVTLP